jgi:Uma2 family endonuclease
MSLVVAKYGEVHADDLLRPDMPSKFVEIIDGDLIVMTPAGKYHNRVSSNFEFVFRLFCKSHPELDFGGDNDGFLISRNPDTLLSPDATLYRRRKDEGKTWLEFAPEIVVEIISPSNLISAIAFKRSRFFDAGSEQFWIVDPNARKIEFCFVDGRKIVAEGDETIDCEGIAKGLQIKLADVFKAD